MMVEKKQWHEKYFVDPLNKYAANRLIKSITGGINGGVNVLLIGSFLSIISIVLEIRSLPRSPSSSRPAVSITATGPRGSSSMLFMTGSVVVPAWSETKAVC